ncbi:uncharacterized protein LOC123918328 isoform X1 [Trifolium pratense]|uniref:Uncharacterized protein n=1 Tax=Trifolium pratense TaxID=57577 RepID=A0ACB0J980_TRIPR|nr:uncharacterized protein LOC123918328 isoform X1 [Trifolium pratense]XP_045826296.1 uncharacterized protein LOC123918328 isoform X1 [Trifolium pratense]XP_045826297.1 uncharacterized protein LOC123918328 isoform X1 [Trifolium pratense]XP_045826298.1 uncharacterized protein LOC123918328 isoform X1 [Trifolium pratense]XP_045826299.1 uncharacterized protein LOC123918328 isoform X1 [Trifolium pratense]CAJ2641125.1 unnamed protein product [Trifolium pratense]
MQHFLFLSLIQVIMLIQSSLLSSVEAGLCYAFDDGKDFHCDWMPSGETCQVCLKCNKYPVDRCRKAEPMEGDRRNAEDPYNSNCLRSCGQPSTASIMTENTAPNIVYRRKAKPMEGDRRNADDLYNSNCLRSCGQPSTASITTENTAPNIVYKRKKLRKGSIAPHFKPGPTDVQTSANFLSVTSSSLHLSSAEDQTAAFPVKHQIEMVKDPTLPSVFLDGVAKDTTQKKLGIDSVNDSCSSSKSNMVLVSDSIETEMDVTGECSSSSVIAMDVAREDLTEKDFCINILRSHGLFRGDNVTDNVVSVEGAVTRDSNFCSRSCKICGHSDSSLKMILCDNCEDSYHPSCYSSRLKRIPIDEWFCHSCLNKRHQILKKIIKSPGINSEMTKCRTISGKDEMNPILLMLRDTEPYTTDVRVGKGFQATVLDWSGPVKSDEDDFPEPLEITSSEFYRPQEENIRNPTRLGSIGNWLQCREVIDKTSRTICGKWRRAPLFEVQIDDWECFCAINWDPLHADCAVPQEVETDEVLKQLKYIEMLRPRLAAKQRKSDCTKNGD